MSLERTNPIILSTRYITKKFYYGVLKVPEPPQQRDRKDLVICVVSR